MPEQIRLVDIEPNPNNPRKYFDNEKLESLAQSIREHGIIQALVVTPLPATEGQFQRYRLICGERRLRAAKMLGLATVPADVQDTLLLPSVEAERMLIENLQRQDLDAVEEARAYQALLKEHDHTQEALGEKLGLSQGYIANRLRLLELPEPVQQNISHGIISPSHGRVLAGHKALPEVVLRKAAKSIADNAVPVSRAANEVYKAIAEHGRDLRRGMAEFDPAECEGCQHMALGLKYRYGDKPDEEYCLNHQCYDKKQEEVRQAREAEIAQKAEGLLQQALDLTSLGYGNYEQINAYGKTEIDAAECAECINWALGKVSYDSELREVCLNPSCYRKKKAAMAREKGKEVRDALHEEMNHAAILAGLKAAALKRWEPGGDQVNAMFILDRPTLIYLSAMILASVDQLHDRKITLFRYLKDKFGWDQDLLKRGSWGLLNDKWDHFRQLLDTLTDQQLLGVIFEWPAMARGLNSAAGWVLQQGTSHVQEIPQADNAPIEKILDQFVNGPGPTPDETKAEKERFKADLNKRFGSGEDKSIECADILVAAQEPDPNPVRALIGRIIRTHYDTGGVVAGVSGPKDDGFYTVNYRDPSDKRKQLSTINSITVIDGVVMCEGVSLTVLDKPEELPSRRYLDDKGREFFVSPGLGSEYGTFWQSEKGGLHRVKSPAMSMTSSREEAQANLDVWAKKKGLRPMEPAGDDHCQREQTA